MSKHKTTVDFHATESETALALDREWDDDVGVSVNLIDDALYLGNLSCARDAKALERMKITHILTIDLVPLPLSILERPNLTFHYIKLADVPKEDLISHLPLTNNFIRHAIENGGTVLVHCYFGVSRSAAVVIAYIMEKYGLCYEEAFHLVKSKRRFIGPNPGFVAQLKLFGHMGYCINRDDPRFKQFRLRMAGQKLKEVKILPQLFADLVKPDPGLVQERPDPIVYRCKKCRRIVASQNNIIPHMPKDLKIELAKKNLRPPPSKLTSVETDQGGQILINKLQTLATEISKMMELTKSDVKLSKVDVPADSDAGPSEVLLEMSDENMVDGSVVSKVDLPEVCRMMWFVEPMAWMKGVQHDAQGKLHCPKCQNKIGSFSWIMGCKCPCGQKVAPAFYLVPSKVEWSNIVQNVQITV